MNDRRQPDELETLRQQNVLLAEENSRLREMLGIEAQGAPITVPKDVASNSGITGASSSASKIELFQSQFRGRFDAYARRWQSRSGGSGYSPVCGNEWRSGLCDKRRVKCADCANRELLPLDARA
ncbi:MAG: DEAD/DEAH box helicase, partial [Actinomycetota bacterium]|nr:DEAD/DEAH box helicase [Actinomycetota bacterium]